MERQVAQGRGEVLLRLQDAAKDMSGVALMTARDLAARPLLAASRAAALTDTGSMSDPTKRQPYSRAPAGDRCSWPRRLRPAPSPPCRSALCRHSPPADPPPGAGNRPGPEWADRGSPAEDPNAQCRSAAQAAPVQRLDGGRIGEIQGRVPCSLMNTKGSSSGCADRAHRSRRGLMAVARVQSGFVLGLHAGPAAEDQGATL